MTENQGRRPTYARIWRGRTASDRADEYQTYNYEEGIKPLERLAMGVLQLRDDREDDSEFLTISFWDSMESMSEFTNADPTEVHHLDRDPEFLLELPDRIQILRITAEHWNTRPAQG